MNSELHGKNNQAGAALVVSLVLLLVMTILAISTMNTARLELAMAGNTQYAENAFQLAETGIDINIQNINNGAPLPPPGATNCPAVGTIPLGAPVAMPALVGTFQIGTGYCGDAPDLSGGSSLGKIQQYHYRTDAQGITQTRGATSLNRQGFFIRGPAGG
jgi:Tfp pilus assembly protein PilX